MIYKALVGLTLTLFSFQVLACPTCAGSMDNPKDTYTVYILMVFVASTYIPFYLLYRMVYKFRDPDKLPESNQS